MTEKQKSVLKKAGIVAIVAAVVFGPIACKRAQAPEINTVPQITQKNLAPYFPLSTKAEVRDIEHHIIKTRDTQPPTHTYVTYTQEAADAQAQRYAKKEKADKVIKQTSEKDIIDEKGEPTGQKTIQNDYYAINMNRKHDIKVGAAAVGGDMYATASYRNRDVQYEAFYSPKTKEVGGAVSLTVAKW